jgi:proteasome lid subunit RPN8/RPN11
MKRAPVDARPPNAESPDIEEAERPVLHLPLELRARISAFAAAGYPRETCGLLVGRAAAHVTLVEDLVQGRNLSRERARDRYELAPEDLLAADGAARERGLEIVGVWHSHPDHPAVPSSTDREGAWAGWSYLIAAVEGGGLRDLRSWRLRGDLFVEEAMTS